ncbi:hypothetical protein T12_5020 [Trichinella patagoniensis]|uniref:Uncharacterized protein n=1 Tax=Trichinella patagoniensis TaxID=990121 RepID=A0A0V0W1I6_9BILA|nr:hypothetical protein T12_5020 [Trichinella patagoniensis]
MSTVDVDLCNRDNSGNGHSQSRKLNFVVLLHVPLGQVDVEEKGLLGVRNLDPILLM